jgi:hypothetical protein
MITTPPAGDSKITVKGVDMDNSVKVGGTANQDTGNT